MEYKIFEKQLFIWDLANNHCADVNHGLQIIKQIGDVCKQFPQFQYGFKFQYRDIENGFIHPDYKEKFEYKYIKRFSETKLSEEEFMILKNEIEELGFFTVVTPFDESSVDKIEKQNFDCIKIASCSMNDWPLLERVVKTNLPLIVSTAGQTLEDIDKVYEFLTHRKKEFAFLHCVAEYPVIDENLELNQITFLKEIYKNIPVGFSSHEAPKLRNTDSVKLSMAKGISIFECHVDIDCITKNKYSRTALDIKDLLEDAFKAYEMCGVENGRHYFSEKEKSDLYGLRRGVFAKEDLKEGQKLTKENIFFAIPLLENHLSANDIRKYTDYTLNKNIKKNDHIVFDDVIIFNREERIKEIYEKVKSFIKQSKIEVPEKFELDLSHHYGLDSFEEYGTAIITFINEAEYCKKLLITLPNQKHPEHYHYVKKETFFPLYGELELAVVDREQTLEDFEKGIIAYKNFVIQPGESYTVEREVAHSFTSKTGCIIEEVSTSQVDNDSFYSDNKVTQNKDRKTRVMFSK